MDDVINEALAKEPSEEALQRAKSRNLAAFSRGTERLGVFGGQSDVLAQSMTYGGSPDSYLSKVKIIANANVSAVKAAGRKWPKANHYTMLVKPCT